ncbi:uncharacterized protein LOC141648645 [Silene latifolia]|uniref:uncharacterized protein LOC141648645 n=1 Tax=Silene latifolia TaxID=37657 RepID=UPI003D76BBA5
MWDNITWLKKFFMGIDVILADETRNAIQASINRDDAPHYKEKLKEGHMYLIKNFEVKDNKPTYRCVANNLIINFIFATFVQPLEEDVRVPQQVFDLAPYDTIKLRADKEIQLTGIVIDI